MIFLQLPKAAAIAGFINREKVRNFTYPHHGASFSTKKIPGFDNDFQRVCIGQGQADFAHACDSIRQWKMFPPGWTIISQANTPIQTGETVAMFARAFGLWWRNSCRIVYTVNEPDRFGFAYGTLPGHIECGEELFQVEIDQAGQVWYLLRAFSKPHHIFAKIGYPLVRNLQARFRRDSAQAMKDYVAQNQ